MSSSQWMTSVRPAGLTQPLSIAPQERDSVPDRVHPVGAGPPRHIGFPRTISPSDGVGCTQEVPEDAHAIGIREGSCTGHLTFQPLSFAIQTRRSDRGVPCVSL